MAKRLSDEKREILRAAWQTGASFKEAAKMAGCSESAARKIINGWDDWNEEPRSEEERQAENEKKAEFVKIAYEIAERAVRLLNKRLMLAEENLDAIMDAVKRDVYNEGADSSEANKLLHELRKAARELTQPSLKEIASVISTMYDRAEKAAGDSCLTEDDGVVKINE